MRIIQAETATWRFGYSASTRYRQRPANGGVEVAAVVLSRGRSQALTALNGSDHSESPRDRPGSLMPKQGLIAPSDDLVGRSDVALGGRSPKQAARNLLAREGLRSALNRALLSRITRALSLATGLHSGQM